MSISLGDVSAFGEARKRNPAWGQAQDAASRDAELFLARSLPKEITLSRESVKGGTKFVVARGAAAGSSAVFDAFRRKFPGRRRTSFRVLHGDREEYFLGFADPREAWRAARGRAFIMLCFFLLVAVFGAILMFRPRVLLDALE